VSATRRSNKDQYDGSTGTLGDLLCADKAKTRVSEKDWVVLIQSIASGDQLALHALYERTHRIVFTLIMQITHNRETAEELTLDVFHDVWRRAPSYDAAGGTVVGWIMNQARSFSELTYSEVAARLNQPLGTIKTRIRSGLAKLRQALAAEGKES
jgi:DNA-directed RNA polymerase specialized sigma24 family protein